MGFLQRLFRPLISQEAPDDVPAPAADKWTVALNAALPAGCGPDTAQAEQVPPGRSGSYDIASKDWVLMQDRLPAFERAAVQYGLPTSLLLAVASRESHGGAALDANGWGDSGHAFGVLQVDRRSHHIVGTESPTSEAHLLQGAGILRDALDDVCKDHPDWPPELQIEGSLVAYNAGVRNVVTITHLNQGSTNDDYGADTLARAKWYETALTAPEPEDPA